MYDLSRFHVAQEDIFEIALKELKRGQKQSHWMWFIFPQLKSLGRSRTADFYGINDLREAHQYLADPILKKNLLEVARAVLSHAGKKPSEILGNVDALKLRSCATLFREAGGGPEFQEILDQFYDGKPCELTILAIEGR